MPIHFKSLLKIIKATLLLTIFLPQTHLLTNQTPPPFSPPHIPQVLGAQHLANYTPLLHNCLQKTLTPAQYELYIADSGQQRNLLELGSSRINQTEHCFNIPPSQYLNSQDLTCLQTSLTKEKYDQLINQQSPSPADLYNIAPCFSTPQINEQLTQEHSPPNLINLCLHTQLSNYASLLQDPHLSTSTDITTARHCLLSQSSIVQPPQILTPPTEVSNCLLNELGAQRHFEILTSGTSTPAEQNTTKHCFTQIHSLHRQFLPHTTLQVPFLPQDQNQITITHLTLNYPNQTLPTLQIAGTSPPNAIVDVHLLQHHLTLWTTSDAQGKWVIQTSYPIQPGDETSIAVSNNPLPTVDLPAASPALASAPYQFSVVKKTNTSTTTQEQYKVIINPSFDLWTQRTIITILLLTSVTILIYTYLKHTKKSKSKKYSPINR